jgi:hypothetical protein
LITASISSKTVIAITPTTKKKEQYPPAVIPTAETAVVIIADALTYSHAFRKFTH